MSFDLGVWYPHERLSHAQAGKLYVALCEGTAESPPPHPAVDAFYEELIAKHPERNNLPDDKVGDHDYCPWSCEIDRSPGHIIIASVWPKADYVDELVKQLARKHGLAVYDPQSERIIYPNDIEATAQHRSWWKFW